MDIIRYRGDMAGKLTMVYNEAVAGVPHCHPVDTRTFSHELLPATGGKSTRERLHSEACLVATSRGSILGYAHLAAEKPKKKEVEAGTVAGDDPGRGAIRFLWYRPGRRKAGQELLEASHDYFRERGLERVMAFDQDYRYPFLGFKHSYLSDAMGHVQALFWSNGYQRVKGEVFLDWPEFEPRTPPEPGFEVETGLELVKGMGRLPGIKVRALKDGKQVGICECLSCAEFSKIDEMEDWAFTQWIGVEEDYQGRGLGRYLLRRALLELHSIGYRHAAISTDWKNYRAFTFYTNFGYRVVDWTHAYGLDSIPGPGRRKGPSS